MSRGIQNIFHRKCLFIITEYVSNMLVKFDFNAVKNISLNRLKYSFFMEIEKPEFSFWISSIPDSSRESICFLIAGNVHQISLSSALIDIHCLRKTKYFNMSTLVLLQKSFSKFILKIGINTSWRIKILGENTSYLKNKKCCIIFYKKVKLKCS